MQRREWIKKAGLGGIAAISSNAVFGHVDTGFEQDLADMVGSADIKPDNRIELLVPEDAANGAVVPVGVVSSVPDTLKIVLFVDNHDLSKVAQINTTNSKLAPRFSTHLQLNNAATITALVQSSLGWFSNSASVKTLGESCEQ